MNGCTLFALEAGSDHLHITARLEQDLDSSAAVAANICDAVSAILQARGMRILHERVFGDLHFYENYVQIREKYTFFAHAPFTYIQGMPVHGGCLSGMQIHAVKAVSYDNPKILYDDGRPCGTVWKRNGAAWLQLSGLHGLKNGNPDRREQTAAAFDNIKRLLASQSSDFFDIVRTWFYLEDILDWYRDFNAVRTEKFQAFGLIAESIHEQPDGCIFLPASTGIGGRNPHGAACCGDVLAVSGNIQTSMLSEVLQPSAFRYGSAFSRGVCVEDGTMRHIFISGTAAIDEEGRSLHSQDAEAQINKTLDVVGSLLAEKGAQWDDVCSASVYLKRVEDWTVYEKIAARRGVNLPAVFLVADICRDELLFEMDALAAVDKRTWC